MIKSWVISALVAVGLSGCVSTNTFFPEPLREDLTYNWHVVDVQAVAPRTLTTSYANTQMPDVDIIWRGDGPGDVYAQVEQIIREAMAQAVSGFHASVKGGRPVIIRAEVVQFHSLTERARSNIGGIHNTDLILTVVDANTGELLAGPAAIEADVKAFGAREAESAVAVGQTMRVRIIQRVSDVIATYLGVAGERAVTQGRVVQVGR